MTLDNRHKIARPYWARPGLALFAKKADDDAEGGVDPLDGDDPEDEDEDDEDDPDEGKSEDELRAELKAVRTSLGKANGSSAKRRQRIKDLQAQLNKVPTPKPKKTDDDDDELDVEAIRETARREGEKVGNDRVKRAELRTALAKSGVRDEAALKRLSTMVNLDDLDLNDDGTVDGIDDAIDELKGDLPQLFATRRRRESVAGANDRDGDRGGDRKPKTASEKAADQLLGRGRS